MFTIVFMSFLCLFYLLFISKLSECSSLLGTAQMLFEMMLMKFDAHQLSDAAAFLGPFSFSLFIIFVVFICMSMFFSIIGDNFRLARENIKDTNRHLYSYALQTFIQWTGLKKTNDEDVHVQKDERMRSEYRNPIEQFPEKVDQLLNALNSIYVNQSKDKLKLKTL
ncbi:unnamed protein product [Adineta ricciae]|uniref:Polycystin cation channel PKD1/PKD2 domain-containing protein n=2 Tax=Adineta ricciae TaxID=249248 RepID=A0A816AQP0_ADIRI|nr:unnamed protein product [Adineta ricciae]